MINRSFYFTYISFVIYQKSTFPRSTSENSTPYKQLKNFWNRTFQYFNRFGFVKNYGDNFVCGESRRDSRLIGEEPPVFSIQRCPRQGSNINLNMRRWRPAEDPRLDKKLLLERPGGRPARRLGRPAVGVWLWPRQWSISRDTILRNDDFCFLTGARHFLEQ